MGLEIIGASKFLTGISRVDVSQDDLAMLSECDLYTKRENGLLFVTFVCKFGKKLKPLENYLTLQDVSYNSPLVARA